jgi:uncharacterized protein
MNILFVSGHPAQVHNFKHVKFELERKGHRVYWLATDKDISKQLLEVYNIEYTLLKKPGKGIISKIFTFISNTAFSIKYLNDKKINIVVSRVSPYLAISSFFRRVYHITLSDTETAGYYDWFFCKFSSVLLTSISFKKTLRSDQIRFNGNIELFYLHPNRFIPCNNVENILDITPDDPYVVMRFVNWAAYHDRGSSGIFDENKIKAAEMFSRYARVFISSEDELPPQLEIYKIKIPHEKIHHVLSRAKLFFGESATMASECAVLGTTAIYLDKIGRGYTDEEGKYGLVYNYKESASDQKRAIQKAIELLKDPSLKVKTRKQHSAFLKNKIDMTAFMVWFIENYPESLKIMRENPEYQYNFR